MIDDNNVDDRTEESEETHNQPERDESLLPAKIPGKPFSKENQPSSDAKKAGWLKKKRNKELAQYLLNRAWRKRPKEDQFTKEMFEYFDITEDEAEELTHEAVIMLKQIAMAQKNGDNTAASQLFERAFGKPLQTIAIDDDGVAPQINITVQQVDGVQIAESESDVDTTQTIQNETQDGSNKEA